MKNILAQIHDFDSQHLSLTEIYHQEKDITYELEARHAFGEVSAEDFQTLRNMLSGITQNKIKSFENALVKPKKIQDQSIAEIFVQKIAIPAKNTRDTSQAPEICWDGYGDTPFYNMRVSVY